MKRKHPRIYKRLYRNMITQTTKTRCGVLRSVIWVTEKREGDKY